MLIGQYKVVKVEKDRISAREISLAMPPTMDMNVLVSRSLKSKFQEVDPGAMLPPSEDPRFIPENMGGIKNIQIPEYRAEMVIGEVIEVTGTKVRIKLTSPDNIKIGYIANLVNTTSFGMERPAGICEINAIIKDEAVASVLEMEIKPRIGTKVTISPQGKNKKVAPPAKKNSIKERNKKEPRISIPDVKKTDFEKDVETGDPRTQNKLGRNYQNGIGVSQNYKKAVYWYRKAADQGYADGQNNMGWMYQKGLGVKKDLGRALYWYRKAADQGYSIARYNVGTMYMKGTGIGKDPARAVTWFLNAADQGYDKAQNRIGKCYQLGTGVIQDYQKAVYWYRKAADQGYADGQNNMGWMYLNGIGVKKDLGRAFDWFRKAADQGHSIAQNNLGTMYVKGAGVAHDRDNAIFWYKKSAEKGNETAIKNLERLGERL